MKYAIIIIAFLIPMSTALASKAPATDIRIMVNPCQKWYDEPMMGCVRYSSGKIEIDAELSTEMKYFVLYHEEGHWYTHNKLSKFKKLSKDEEEIADNFAEWIIRSSSVSSKWRTAFDSVCDSKCVKAIKAIKI